MLCACALPCLDAICCVSLFADDGSSQFGRLCWCRCTGWGQVPPGCSVQSGGDWAGHYNRGSGANCTQDYTPICLDGAFSSRSSPRPSPTHTHSLSSTSPGSSNLIHDAHHFRHVPTGACADVQLSTSVSRMELLGQESCLGTSAMRRAKASRPA